MNEFLSVTIVFLVMANIVALINIRYVVPLIYTLEEVDTSQFSHLDKAKHSTNLLGILLLSGLSVIAIPAISAMGVVQ